MTPTAVDILKLLEDRHRDDLFAAEVCARNGSLRLDAWAMKRTWSEPTTGYEIKVTRADWQRDHKLERYQDHVHRLIVVCPHGLIQPSEMPQGIGLQWTPNTGSRLVTKRRAAINREARWTECLHSLAINRVDAFAPSRRERSFDPRLIARRWLDGKASDYELGRTLATEMARRVACAAHDAKDLEALRGSRDRLRQLASDAGFHSPEAAIEGAAAMRGSRADPQALRELRSIGVTLGNALRRIERLTTTDVRV